MSTTETILVPFDESPQAETALEYALELPDAKITILTVIDPFDINPETPGYQSPIGRAGMPGYSREWYEPVESRIKERFKQAQETADSRGVVLSNDIKFGDPARSIVRYADEHEITHIVMGSHGRSGLPRIVSGSVSEGVLRRSSVPVTVVR